MGYLETEPNANFYTEMKEHLKKTIDWIFLIIFFFILLLQKLLFDFYSVYTQKTVPEKGCIFIRLLVCYFLLVTLSFIEGLLK